MKKSLLFAAVALLAVTAGNAQMKRSDMKIKKIDNVERVKEMPKTKLVEAKINEGAKKVYASQLTPRENVKAWYNRPAGAFYYDALLDDEDGGFYGFKAPFVVMKPYEDYTWKNVSEDAESYQWLVQMYVYNNGWARQWLDTDETDLVVSYGWEYDTVPSLTAYAAGGSNTYQLYHNENKVNPRTGKVTTTTFTCQLAATPTMHEMFGGRMWGASHFPGVRNREDEYVWASYYGAQLHPHGNMEHGLYFGKNDDGLDGICQIFEKPEHPYALLSVACHGGLTVDEVNGGQLTANVYKLKIDQPQYQEGERVILTDDDLELLSSTTLDIDTAMASDYMLVFPIQETDGDLTFESSLHIDFPILVEITGYNGEVTVNAEEGKLEVADNGILDFSGAVTTDEVNDEGFGEQAFIKRLKWYDDEGNILEEPYYRYEGLNYFFQSGAMKSGFNIFIEVETPFMTFNYNAEDGEYEFPVEGGSYHKTFEGESGPIELDAIQIFSWYPSEDGWDITTVDGEDVPDWLTIETEDLYEMDEETGEEEFTNLVDVAAEAAPLPAGVKGRECTVRFAVVGAELLYHFKQGDTSQPTLLTGDVNRDGRVNVSDVSTLINMILGIEAMDQEAADVNGDGRVNVSDVTALINIILGITA